MAGVCLSSICSHRQVHSGRTEHYSVDDSPLVGTDLVPSSLGSGGRLLTMFSHETGSPEGPAQQTTPTGRPREPPASCLESVRGHLSAAGISQQAAKLLVTGWSQGTNAADESAWMHWLGWCNPRQMDPVSYGINPFLDFIGSLLVCSTGQLMGYGQQCL